MQINNFTTDDNIKANIADALMSDNINILIFILYNELKKREVFDKMDNQEKIMNDLISFVKIGDEQKVSKYIDKIVNIISSNEYNNQLNNALNSNDAERLTNIIYQLLIEKQTDTDIIIKKNIYNLGLQIDDKNIDRVKNMIMIGNSTGSVKELEKKLSESKEGRLVLNDIKKSSINIVNDVKSKLRNLSIISESKNNKISSLSTNFLNDIKDDDLKKLIYDVIAYNYTNAIVEKRFIISTAYKLGIHLSENAYNKTILEISKNAPSNITKTIVEQLSKYKIGKIMIRNIKNKALTLSNKDKANNAEIMVNALRLDIERAKVDVAISRKLSDMNKVKLLQSKLNEFENITVILKEHANNTQIYDDSRNLINIANRKYKQAKRNLEKVLEIIRTTSNDPVIERTLKQALSVAKEHSRRTIATLIESKKYIQNKWLAASNSYKKVKNISINNPDVIKSINRSIEIKNKISGAPEIIDSNDITKSSLVDIKDNNLKGLINDVIKLNIAKADLEKKIIIGTANKLGLNISDKNYNGLRMAIASTNTIGDAKILIVALSKTPAGKKLINNIKEKATNAIKHNKARDANIYTEFITEEARRLNDTASITNNPNDIKIAQEALKNADEARIATIILNEHAKAAAAVSETKSLIEVAIMKLNEAKKNFESLQNKVNTAKNAEEKENIEKNIRLAKIAVENSELKLAASQVIVKKLEQNSTSTGNKVINYLQDKPHIQAEINKISETKESAKKAIEALKAGDRKELVSSVKDLMQKKNDLTKGSYKSAGSVVGLNLSNHEVK